MPIFSFYPFPQVRTHLRGRGEPVVSGAVTGCESVAKDEKSSLWCGDSCVQLRVFAIQTVQVSSSYLV